MRDDDTHPFQAEDDAATPLTNDEKTGLIPSWVTYRHELNEKRGSLPLSRGRWMKDFRIAHPAKQDKSLCDKSLCIDW